MTPLLETNIPGLPKRRGKVRDVYDLGDGRLLIVATDRISAFDHILPNGIPDKGRVLTGISLHWFRELTLPCHPFSADIDDARLDLSADVRDALVGRSTIVRKAEVIPFECVVRGYLSGSGWREYRESGTVCGEALPPGLVESSMLIRPIFTPATKAAVGHDENVPFSRMADELGAPLAERLKAMSVSAYRRARASASVQGLILADTKFEFGLVPGDPDPVFIDEALTPDSSRYWPADTYNPGGPQPSFDKQFVRDWLESTGWDKQGPPPSLPDDVVAKSRAKYIDAYEILTGGPFPWK